MNDMTKARSLTVKSLDVILFYRESIQEAVERSNFIGGRG